MNNQNISSIIHRWNAFFWLLIPSALSIITFFVYYPCLGYVFMFDDLPTIINYFHVRSIDFKGQFFSNPRWISRLWNQITYHFYGANPFVFRIANVFMHLVIGVLIFFIVLHLCNHVKKNMFLKTHALLLATFTSMLFLLHPVQTQTVTYITQMRLEGLVSLFTMLVIFCFIYATSTKNLKKKYGLYGLMFFLTFFALGTKEIIIVLPALLILIDWFFIAEGDWQSIKSRWWVHTIVFCIVACMMVKYGFLTPHYVKIATGPVHNNRGNILTSNHAERITWYPFLLSQVKVLLHYLWIFICPLSLSFDYDLKLSSHLYDFDVIMPFLLLTSLLVCAAWCYYRYNNSVFAFGLLWFFVAMLPRTSIFLSTELVCDYKTYPAAFGMMFLLAFLLVYVLVFLTQHRFFYRICQNLNLIMSTSAIVLCCVLACATSLRNQIWRSELDFWADAIIKAPKSRGFNNYAIALWEAGRAQEAMEYFRKAIEKDSWYAEPHVNLATIYQMRKEYDKALTHYGHALEIGEAHPELFNNLGMLHFDNQSWDAAERCLKQAIELKPYYSKPHYNLGKLYQLINRNEEALICYENALKGDYQDADLYYLHGSLCAILGKPQQAIKSLEKIDAHHQDTAFLLGCCYYDLPNYAKAEEYLHIAYSKEQGNKMYMYNYAQALLNVRKYAQALPLYEQLSKFPQDFPYAQIHLAKCLASLEKKEEAKKILRAVVASKLSSDIMQDALLLQKELKLS